MGCRHETQRRFALRLALELLEGLEHELEVLDHGGLLVGIETRNGTHRDAPRCIRTAAPHVKVSPPWVNGERLQ